MLVIKTKNYKGKLPLFCGKEDHVTLIYGIKR